MARTRVIGAVGLLVGIFGSTAVQELSTQPLASVKGGVYTSAQAKRGEDVYVEWCVACHSVSLVGTEFGPALIGDEFLGKWNGKTVGDLFELMRTLMPADGPGRLTRQNYADLAAYLLKANDYQEGSKELSAELSDLAAIRIETGASK